MRKYLKLGVIALVAVAVLAAVIGTTVAFAGSSDGDADTDGGPGKVFVSKVATILGLEEEQVADAFRQAGQEMSQEAREAREQRLKKAIEDGLITEEEATQIREWWQDRPEALQSLGQPGHHQIIFARQNK